MFNSVEVPGFSCHSNAWAVPKTPPEERAEEDEEENCCCSNAFRIKLEEERRRCRDMLFQRHIHRYEVARQEAWGSWKGDDTKDLCSVRSRRWRGAGTRAGRAGASARPGPVNTGAGARELQACLLLTLYASLSVSLSLAVSS